jgi:hypothetical protein
MKKNSIFYVVLVVVSFVCAATTFAQRTGGFNEVNLDDGAGSIAYLTTSGGSLGINGLDLLPNPCAILDLNSTTKGFLMPRMNTAQRDALCPIPGMAVYNISTNSFDYYNGGSWQTLASSSSWLTTLNSLTADGVDNLIGSGATSVVKPFELRVDGNRIVRYETNNRIIGGDVGNTISGASNYAVIAGGGSPGFTNSITGGDYGTIGGGGANVVSAQTGTIAGGGYNQATAFRSTVAGGAGNTASGQGAFVGGGEAGAALGANNTASGNNSVVVGGVNNLASGIGSFIGGGGYDGGGTGGNTASGNASTIGGGMINTVLSQYGTIAGGRNNSTAAAGGATVGGGIFNSATAAFAVVAGGDNNSASGQESFVGGGALNQATGAHSFVAGGVYGVASHESEFAHASGRFAAAGDAQTSVLVARNETTTAAASELFLDGIGSRATIPTSTTWSFRALVTGKTAAGASAGYQIVGLIENIGGTTAFVGVPIVTVLGEDAAAWDCVATADNANDALAVTVTGAAATTIRWVARIDLTQVTF